VGLLLKELVGVGLEVADGVALGVTVGVAVGLAVGVGEWVEVKLGGANWRGGAKAMPLGSTPRLNGGQRLPMFPPSSML
jgi:hypothetical protein